MPTYECANCGETEVERSYNVTSLSVTCPSCDEFATHVNMDHPRVRQVLEELGIEPSAAAIVDRFSNMGG